MFHNITQNYDGINASLEIMIMLLGAFILGYLFRWVFAEMQEEETEVIVSHKNSKTKVYRKDDLTIIEGIGPKIQELLNKEGIKSYADLAASTNAKLTKILKAAGPKFQMHEPRTWPKQAKLAAAEKWDDLADYQEFLFKGKDHL